LHRGRVLLAIAGAGVEEELTQSGTRRSYRDAQNVPLPSKSVPHYRNQRIGRDKEQGQ
jgi:hypothetical protein